MPCKTVFFETQRKFGVRDEKGGQKEKRMFWVFDLRSFGKVSLYYLRGLEQILWNPANRTELREHIHCEEEHKQLKGGTQNGIIWRWFIHGYIFSLSLWWLIIFMCQIGYIVALSFQSSACLDVVILTYFRYN